MTKKDEKEEKKKTNQTDEKILYLNNNNNKNAINGAKWMHKLLGNHVIPQSVKDR